MGRRSGPTTAVSMPHGKTYSPAKFCEVAGARRAPKHDPDHILASALECAKHKTGLGYRLWGELGVTGGRPRKRGRRHATPRHVRHPGKKHRNKGGRTKKRRDGRVSHRERSRINARFGHQKDDWLYKLMHELAALGFALVLEEKTINRLLVRSNRNMSREERDLLKMGLSRGRVRAVADSVFSKYGLPVYGVTPAGTSSACPACGEKLWAARYGTKSWESWGRTKACVPCLYCVDRDSVAAINIVWRGVSAYEPAAGPEPSYGGDGRQVAGDWEQCVPRLVRMLLGAAVVWFPYTGEGRRPKGGAKNPPYDTAGDARPPDDRLDASNGLTGLGPPGETPGPYVSGTHLRGAAGLVQVNPEQHAHQSGPFLPKSARNRMRIGENCAAGRCFIILDKSRCGCLMVHTQPPCRF